MVAGVVYIGNQFADCVIDTDEKDPNHTNGKFVTFKQWWAKLLRFLTVNSLSYFVKIKY